VIILTLKTVFTKIYINVCTLNFDYSFIILVTSENNKKNYTV